MRLFLLLLAVTEALGFVARHGCVPRVARHLALSASSADEVTQTVHGKLFDAVNADLGLKLTDFTEVYGAKSWSAEGWSGTTEWYDEAKGSKLTGVSKNAVTGASNGAFSRTLNIWMGPGYMLPHLLLTVGGEASGGHYVVADYVARGPTPLGSDQSYLDTYFAAKDVLDAFDSALKLPGAVPLPPPSSFFSRLLRSPVAVAVGGLSAADANTIATGNVSVVGQCRHWTMSLTLTCIYSLYSFPAHVTRWLAWLKDAKAVEARQRGAINTRDDKQRQFFYRAAVTERYAFFCLDTCHNVRLR